MAKTLFGLAALSGLLASFPGALAGFDPEASNNIVVYWGTGFVSPEKLAEN